MFVENKVAIVTGGASGIGFQYALELLTHNLKAVTLADVDDAKGDEAVAQITKDFGANKALFVKTDVTDQKQVENAFKKTVEKFGNLDIVINNAGVMNEAIWEKEIAINLNGTIYGCLLAMEHYLPKYKSGDEGVLVNISSIAGLQSLPVLPIYAATKHAIIGLTRSLGSPEQYETSKVRVVAICPGPTDTPLMQDLEKKAINNRYLEMLGNLFKAVGGAVPVQSVGIVPKCLLQAIEEGANGSIWVVEEEEIYKLDMLERQQMKKK